MSSTQVQAQGNAQVQDEEKRKKKLTNSKAAIERTRRNKEAAMEKLRKLRRNKHDHKSMKSEVQAEDQSKGSKNAVAEVQVAIKEDVWRNSSFDEEAVFLQDLQEEQDMLQAEWIPPPHVHEELVAGRWLAE